MVQLCLGGNFHTNLRVPFYQGLSLPPFQVLSVNQLGDWNFSSVHGNLLSASAKQERKQE